MSTTKKNLSQEALRQFTGDLTRYRHPLMRNVVYTPGVRFLAEQGDAYWLLDAIVSYFDTPAMTTAQTDDYGGDLIFWWLDVEADQSAELTARVDANVNPFITQEIEYTDFPLDHVEVWAGFDGERWTLYLPSEH